ncbi:hypothetical protein B0H13DRAFT_1854625 [Mycena leptocephala]|nr:hypothetical protein B0H13DRAFT_1854625 [Mycena leptocephala]
MVPFGPRLAFVLALVPAIRLRVEDHFARIIQVSFHLHSPSRSGETAWSSIPTSRRPLVLNEVKVACDSIERDTAVVNAKTSTLNRAQDLTLLEPSRHLKISRLEDLCSIFKTAAPQNLEASETQLLALSTLLKT